MLSSLIEKIAGELSREGIPYMILGGQAVLLFGEPRLTRDIDITLGAGPEALPRVQLVLERVGLEPLAPDPATFVAKTMVLPARDQATGLRVDLIFSNSSYEREALQRARVIKVGQTEVRFISPEDLIIHKLVAGRPRDLEDAKGLLIKNPGLDFIYLRSWLSRLDQALAMDLSQTLARLEKEIKSRRRDL